MAVFDELKSIASTLREADKIPQYEQILSIQEKLLEMQKTIFDLENENRELKGKISLEESLHFERNAYWVINGDEKIGPYCTRCKDSDSKMIRMRIGNYSFGWALCPNCKELAK